VATSKLSTRNLFPHPITTPQLSEFMPTAPLVDSVQAGWANLIVRRYRLPAGEAWLPPVPDPCITIHLSSRVDGVERSFGGAFSTATIDFEAVSYVPPQHGVAWRWRHDLEVLQLHIKRRFIRQYLQLRSDLDMACLEEINWFGRHEPLVAQIGRACLAELQTCCACPDSLYIDSFAALLAARLFHRHAAVPPDDSGRRASGNHKGIEAAIAYIRANLEKRLTLADLAGVANMSVYHFIRQFRSVAGSTPHKYVLNLRIGLAQSLLEKDSFSIVDIGQKTGFSSHSHFTNTFRRVLGVTPTAYRRAQSRRNRPEDGLRPDPSRLDSPSPLA
jgi:AraC family transcriptional regulator